MAALYGPCRFRAEVGKARERITIREQTDFPFSDRLVFEILAERPVSFPLWLRIPAWCRKPEVRVNGQLVDGEGRVGSFIRLEREFSPGDRVELSLPMQLELTRRHGGGATLERGPLVFALKIEEECKSVEFAGSRFRENVRPHPDFPQWDIKPASPWNYALAVDVNDLEHDVKVVEHMMTTRPWEHGSVPVELQVPVRRVRNWDYERVKSSTARQWGRERIKDQPDELLFTPELPVQFECEGEVRRVSFVPYGSTRIRLTVLPVCPTTPAPSK